LPNARVAIVFTSVWFVCSSNREDFNGSGGIKHVLKQSAACPGWHAAGIEHEMHYTLQLGLRNLQQPLSQSCT